MRTWCLIVSSNVNAAFGLDRIEFIYQIICHAIATSFPKFNLNKSLKLQDDLSDDGRAKECSKKDKKCDKD